MQTAAVMQDQAVHASPLIAVSLVLFSRPDEMF